MIDSQTVEPAITPSSIPTDQSPSSRGKRLVHRALLNRRSLSLIDQAVISATNMCTSILIGRTCPKAQLGLYASGLSLILLVTAVQSALITVPYTISSPQILPSEHALYKGSTIIQQVALVAASMLVFLAFGLFGFAHSGTGSSGTDLHAILLTLGGVCGIICFRDFARRISYAELHFSFALVLDGTLSLVQLSVIGLLAWRHQLSASRALLSVALASLTASLMWCAVNRKSISLSFAHAAAGFQVNWRLGKWLFSSSVLWSFCIDQYPWLVTTLRTSTEAALWAAAYGVMAFLNPIVLALNNDAAPRISNDYARHGLAGLTRNVYRSSIIAGLMTLPVLLALLLFGTKLVRFMYGPKFVGVGPIVDLLGIGLWFYAISLSFPYGMLTLKRANIDFGINVACFVSFVALGLPLIHSKGVFGAACSFLIVQTVALILRIAMFRRVVYQCAKLPPLEDTARVAA